ncbi:MAG: hypothetical protein HYV62_06540 [Candidatus Rokubacteria bacterium]|nr:hypothetical protein [Candidatus Rokubacteria bacterium]
MTLLRPETRLAVQAARTAGRLLMRRLGRVGRLRSKGPKDLVTTADLAAERAIRRMLTTRYPEIGFLGEEGGRSGPPGDAYWVVDPLDGRTLTGHPEGMA